MEVGIAGVLDVNTHEFAGRFWPHGLSLLENRRFCKPELEY
jgi:hypothetical protein